MFGFGFEAPVGFEAGSASCCSSPLLMLRLTVGVDVVIAALEALAFGRPLARRSFKPDYSLLPGVITGASIVPISIKCAAF